MKRLFALVLAATLAAPTIAAAGFQGPKMCIRDRWYVGLFQ